MDHREILLQQIVADDGLDRAAVSCGKAARGLLEFGRAEIVGRRVDQIARERDALGDAREVSTVEALGNFKPRPIRLGLAIACELVGTEREGERGKARIMRCVGEAVGAGRKQAGQAAGEEAILLRPIGRLDAEQHAGERAIRAGQQQRLAGLRLEFRGVGEAPRRSAKLRAHGAPRFGIDEPHRNGRAARCREGRMHERSPKSLLARGLRGVKRAEGPPD